MFLFWIGVTTMTTDGALERFLDREAIRDVVTRNCRAIDRTDMDLLRTCHHPGAVLHGRVVPQDFESFTFTREKSAVTLHFITNHSSQIEGDRASPRRTCRPTTGGAGGRSRSELHLWGQVG
jgi:hypothetical protein